MPYENINKIFGDTLDYVISMNVVVMDSKMMERKEIKKKSKSS